MRELFVYILMALMLAGCEVISPDNKLIPVTPKEHGGARNHVLLEFTGFSHKASRRPSLCTMVTAISTRADLLRL